MEHIDFYSSYMDAIDAVQRYAMLHGKRINMLALLEFKPDEGERLRDRIWLKGKTCLYVSILNMGTCFEVHITTKTFTPNLEMSNSRRNFVESSTVR